LLASAAAGSIDASFFSTSVSDIMSHWYGDSERILQALYEEARKNSPSIIFIDEIDSIALSRNEMQEGSRRLLSTLLTELSGFKGNEDRFVFTIAATNTPWDLDEAILSRFPLQVYVPLPDTEACEQILRIQLKELEHNLSLKEVAMECVINHYSGRDIEGLCKQAMWEMLVRNNSFLNDLKIPNSKNVSTRPLMFNDFMKAFQRVRPKTNPIMLKRYELFNNNIIASSDPLPVEGYQ
jgi:katanin p60 ATPase-containing subunit A1